MRPRTVSKSIVLVCIAAVGAGMGLGCARRVPEREREPVTQGQGGAWEAVFLPAGTAASLVGVEPRGRAEYARRDDELPVREAAPLLATAQWPERPRPSVERLRRISLERDARTALFFLPREREQGWDRGWHGEWWGPERWGTWP